MWKKEVIFFFRADQLLHNSNYKDKAIIPLLCYGSIEAKKYLWLGHICALLERILRKNNLVPLKMRNMF